MLVSGKIPVQIKRPRRRLESTTRPMNFTTWAKQSDVARMPIHTPETAPSMPDMLKHI
jgi:hypothetical protein